MRNRHKTAYIRNDFKHQIDAKNAVLYPKWGFE